MANGVSVEFVANKILVIRGKRMMLDRDLAKLYGVPTKVLNQSVKRNIDRFPEDFMFRLTQSEKHEVVTNCDHLNSLRFSYQLPLAFTEQGVAMLSSVLNSPRAVQVNIQIVRAFVKLRRMVLANQDLRRKIEDMENKYDKQFAVVFQAIKQLLEPTAQEKKRVIGFRAAD
jgi:hypothetical protein